MQGKEFIWKEFFLFHFDRLHFFIAYLFVPRLVPLLNVHFFEVWNEHLYGSYLFVCLFIVFGFSLCSYAFNDLNLVFLSFSIRCLVDENQFIDGKQV